MAILGKPKPRLAVLAAGLVLAAAAPGIAYAGSDGNSGTSRDLAAARAATARFQDEATAIAAGYQRTDACVEDAAGVMGNHYINPANLDGALDVRHPQALLYVPRADGGRRLAAVEYIAVDADQNLTTDEDRPSLFGRPFDGPMPGHEPGMPIHYDLHVWVWQHNPAGTFAPFNPASSC